VRWLRRFFYSDDPDVKFVDGLTEFAPAAGQAFSLACGIGVVFPCSRFGGLVSSPRCEFERSRRS
jgi:hypothetical protein